MKTTALAFLLVLIAASAGFGETYHVNNRGRLGR